MSFQSYLPYLTPRVPIYLESEWSYPVNSLYQQYVILNIYIGCFLLIISTVLSIISVLPYFACPCTHWKQMILLTYKYHGILVYIFYDCMNDINSIFKCKCDMLIDKSLYTLQNERSCPFINFWTTVYYIWCINCVFVWMVSLWDEHIWCSMNDLSYFVNHNVLSSFIYPYTPWKRMIIAVVQFLSIVCYIRLCPVCLYEWSRLSCQSYASWPILHVNTPGSTFINFEILPMWVLVQ